MNNKGKYKLKGGKLVSNQLPTFNENSYKPQPKLTKYLPWVKIFSWGVLIILLSALWLMVITNLEIK